MKRRRSGPFTKQSSRHYAHRYRAGLDGFGRSEEDPRGQGASRRRTAQARRDRDQGRSRLEGRSAVPQRQQVSHSQRDRRFSAAPADRCHRPLSGGSAPIPEVPVEETAAAMADPPRAWRDIVSYRRQQFQPRAVYGEAFRKCCPSAYGTAAIQSVRACHRARRLPDCWDNNIVTLAYGALCRGLLSGRMTGQTQFTGLRPAKKN